MTIQERWWCKVLDVWRERVLACAILDGLQTTRAQPWGVGADLLALRQPRWLGKLTVAIMRCRDSTSCRCRGCLSAVVSGRGSGPPSCSTAYKGGSPPLPCRLLLQGRRPLPPSHTEQLTDAGVHNNGRRAASHAAAAAHAGRRCCKHPRRDAQASAERYSCGQGHRRGNAYGNGFP